MDTFVKSQDKFEYNLLKVSSMATNPNKKLKQAILEHCGGFDNAASQIGTSERTLKRATEDGGTIKSEYLIELFDKFGIRPGSILEPTFDNYVVFGEKNDSTYTQIMFYPNVKASAGHGIIPENEQALPISFRSYFIKNTLYSSPKDLIAIKAKGDSMYPEIKDDDLLIIDTSKTTVQSENPYFIVLGEQNMVKDVHSLGKGRYKLISRNNIYKDRIIDESNINEFRILGEVKHIQRTI